MTDKLSGYSTTPASNNAAAPDGWPEGMTAGSVNNSMREYAARVREWYEDPQWIDFGHTIVSSTASSIKVSGDQTAIYSAGRAIRVNQSGSQVGHISGSAYSAPDTSISVTGFTVSSPTQVEVGAIADQSQLPNNLSITAASLTLSATLTVGDLIVTNASITTAVVSGTLTASIVSGAAITASGTLTAQSIAGSMVAGQAAMEAATSTTLAVVPAVVKFNPFVPKAWAKITWGVSETPSITASAGIASVSRVSSLRTDVVFSSTLSSANFVLIASTSSEGVSPVIENRATTGFRIYESAGFDTNDTYEFAIFGDLA